MRGKLFQSDKCCHVPDNSLARLAGLSRKQPLTTYRHGYRMLSDGGLVALWELNSRKLIVRDRCQDPNVGSDKLISISPDEDMLVAAQGAIICRWQLPSGNRLPNIDLAVSRDFKSAKDSPPVVSRAQFGARLHCCPKFKGLHDRGCHRPS